MYREEWLNLMKDHLAIQFWMNGYSFDKKKIRISCGLPSHGMKAVRYKTLGECWHNDLSEDGTYEIFITPTISESLDVASILAHELVHVTVGVENGHNHNFRKCAKAIGLVGKSKSAKPGNTLAYCIDNCIEDIGSYPHATLDMTQRPKDYGRLLKVWCDNEKCKYFQYFGQQYLLRQSRKTIDYGLPYCGVCNERMVTNY